MVKTDDSTIIQDAQIVNDPQNKETQADVLLNLEEMIKNNISRLDELKDEAKINSERLSDFLINDPTYKEHQEKVKGAVKIRNATKLQLLKQPQAADLNNKVKEAKAEIKEINNSLSEYLREYQRMSGATEIETKDGEVREIVFTAKLRARSPIT